MRLSKGKYDGTMAQCVASIGVCQIPAHLAGGQSYSEPISWTDDAVEVAWLAEWVSGKCGKDKSEKKSVAANTAKRQRKLLSERRTRLAVLI